MMKHDNNMQVQFTSITEQITKLKEKRTSHKQLLKESEKTVHIIK